MKVRVKINYNRLSKSVSYRIISSTITVVISALVTGSLKFGISIGIIDLFFKIINYYVFDFFWEKLFKKKIKPCVIWLTGLSGSGKSVIAAELIKTFEKNKIPYIFLDGDEIRKVIKETGYDYHSRKKHNLNVAYIASLFERQGHVVIVTVISPYRDVRRECRAICNNFFEVFINTPIEICEQRDPKGLYKKARAGEIHDFTGVSSSYEESMMNEITIFTPDETTERSAKIIFDYISNRKNFKRKTFNPMKNDE